MADSPDSTDTPAGTTTGADVDPPDAEVPAAPPARSGRPERIPRRVQTAIAVVVLLAALVGLVVTVRSATTGSDRASDSLPDFVDRLIPESGTEVLRQGAVGIDVAAGYDAELVINGTAVPEGSDGLTKDLGTGLIRFVPGPDRVIDTLLPERNCVLANVWPQSQGRGAAEPVSWCFTAS